MKRRSCSTSRPDSRSLVRCALSVWIALLSIGSGRCLAQDGATEVEFVERTQWLMGTPLRIQLPSDREDLDELFRACFDEVRRWDDLLSPWNPQAPLTLLSAGAGSWVSVPRDLLDYLERAQRDALRSGGVFDITLTLDGSSRFEIDRGGSRARLPVGAHRLDPGGDGKGVALDAVAALLDAASVHDAFLDFGGSSFLARGSGPDGSAWRVGLSAYDGSLLGEILLRNTALSVSSTVQREHREDGSVEERLHLIDLLSGEAVRARRSVAVLSSSATDAEVMSTTLAILGSSGVDSLCEACFGIFDSEAAPVFRGGFESAFLAGEAKD